MNIQQSLHSMKLYFYHVSYKIICFPSKFSHILNTCQPRYSQRKHLTKILFWHNHCTRLQLLVVNTSYFFFIKDFYFSSSNHYQLPASLWLSYTNSNQLFFLLHLAYNHIYLIYDHMYPMIYTLFILWF